LCTSTSLLSDEEGMLLFVVLKCYTNFSFLLFVLVLVLSRLFDVTQVAHKDGTGTVERGSKKKVQKPVPFKNFRQSDSRKIRDAAENSVCAGNALIL
jgi:hypothetical protein